MEDATKIGLSFCERVEGFATTQIHGDAYRAAYDRGKADGSKCELTVTIATDDLDRMLSQPDHRASLSGTLTMPELSPQPLTIIDGTFNLTIAHPEQVEQRAMRYRLSLRSAEGKRYWFDGFKDMLHQPLLDVWWATTALHSTIHEGQDASGPVLARGILDLDGDDFMTLMKTAKVTGCVDEAARQLALKRFAEVFARELWLIYGGALLPRGDGDRDLTGRRPLKAPLPALHRFTTEDGTQLRMVRFKGGTKGPVICAGGFGMSSLSFYDDAVPTTLVEFLTAHGYDVWCFDYRASPALASSYTQFTVDDIALQDWPAGVKEVLREAPADSVQVIGHCVGSLSCFMALLSGLQGVRSFVSSQLTPHIAVGPLLKVKAGLPVETLVEAMKALGIDCLTTTVKPGALDATVDWLLSGWPIPAAEKCKSRTCHRISALYGRVFKHAQLDPRTHEALPRLFGVANRTTLAHMLSCINAGHVVDAAGQDKYLPNVAQLNLPITLLSGADNVFFYPSGPDDTFRWLTKNNGTALYQRHVIRDYAHLDCFIGKDAAKDVFPVVLQALDAPP